MIDERPKPLLNIVKSVKFIGRKKWRMRKRELGRLWNIGLTEHYKMRSEFI